MSTKCPAHLLTRRQKKADTALIVIGRNSGGEECDRHLSEDYYLTNSEESLLKEVCSHFTNVVVVLNVNGLIDLSWVRKYANIKAFCLLESQGKKGLLR